jgi:hypothetical protein
MVQRNNELVNGGLRYFGLPLFAQHHVGGGDLFDLIEISLIIR